MHPLDRINNRSLFAMIVFAVLLSGAAAPVTAAETEDSPDRRKWLFSDAAFNESSPVIGPGGIIYLADDDYYLYAINPDGTLRWRFKTGSSSEAAPAVAPDSTIYIGDTGNRFYAINPDGTLKWSYDTGYDIHGSAAVRSDGTVYIGSQDGFLYAFSPKGSLLWKCKAGRGSDNWQDRYYNIETSPAVGYDGTIYVASRNSRLYAITPYGTIKWTYSVDHFFDTGSPSIGSDGTIYAGTHGHRLYAVNPDGTLKWNYFTGTCGNSSPAIAADGTVYIGSNDSGIRCLYAFNGDGTVKWQYQADWSINSSPAIGSDGTVYIASDDCFLYAVDPGGTLLWKYDTGTSIHSSPALAPDGTLYVASGQGLHAIQTDSRGYQEGAPWPCMMHNSTRSVASDTIVPPILHAVRGRVALPDSTPIADVAVSVSGLTTESDGNGYYSLLLPDGSYAIEIDTDSSEIPNSIDITIDGSDITVYPEYWDKHTISGRLVENGVSLGGITVSVDETSAITDENGEFSLVLNDGTFTMLFDAGENCFPESIEITVDGADVNLEDININTLKWRYEAGQWITTYPVIAPDGAVIFGTYEKEIVVLNPDGSLRNKFVPGLTEQHLMYTPSQAEDGTLYLPCWTCLNAYTLEGTLKWSFAAAENGINAAPALKEDGTLYFGSRENLYAIDSGGSLIWSFGTSDLIGSSPSIDRDGTIYFSCYDKHVYALNPDGSLKWSYESTQPFHQTPVIGADGTIYVGGYDCFFHAINPDGTLKWKFETNSATTETPVIDSKGAIYFTNQDSHIYALNSDGTLKWKHKEFSWVPGSAVITSNNTLLAAVSQGYLIEIGTDGVLKWRHYFQDMWPRMPVIAPDGSAYVVMNADETRNGFLSVFQTSSMGYQKASPWPCYMGNNSRTGMAADTKVSVGGSSDNEDDNDSARPEAIVLKQNFPNPFNPSTTIAFSTARAGRVTLEIYTVTGTLISRLLDNDLPAGPHAVTWNAEGLSSGVYLYRITAGGAAASGRMLLMR